VCRFHGQAGASSDVELLYHASPPDDLLNLLRMDVIGTFYSLESSLFLLLFSFFLLLFAL